MTLKTLKPKTNISLILDDEFLKYCELNKIEDVEKFAREVFVRGFTVIKYGEKPSIKPVASPRPSPPAPSIAPPIAPPVEKRKIEKDNIYDE